jgi:hypothetical protein
MARRVRMSSASSSAYSGEPLGTRQAEDVANVFGTPIFEEAK